MAATWIISAILPVVLLIIGAVMKRHIPRDRNPVNGYRTERSMRSQESWEYANRRFGELLFSWGIIALVLVALFNLILPLHPDILVLIDMIPPGICLVVPIVWVERDLKTFFDENGSRKEDV